MQVNEGILTDRTVVTDALDVKETSIGCKAGSPKPPDFVNDMVLHTGLLNPGGPTLPFAQGAGMLHSKTAQRRISGRMPILPALSAAGRSHPGNPGSYKMRYEQ